MVKASSVALGVQGIMRDLGLDVNGLTLKTDATAAKGIASRTGLGKGETHRGEPAPAPREGVQQVGDTREGQNRRELG